MNLMPGAIHGKVLFNEAMIVLMAGLPGSGKTALCRELAVRTGGRVIGKDEVRQALFTADEIEYSTLQDDFCLQVMLEISGFLLQKDQSRSLFLDGRTFSRGYQLDNVIRAAEALHQGWKIIECVCPDEIARQRLETQVAAGDHPAGNRNFQLYLEVKSRFESIGRPKIVIDTSQPLGACVEQALAGLASSRASLDPSASLRAS
jgi:predicted kinase